MPKKTANFVPILLPGGNGKKEKPGFLCEIFEKNTASVPPAGWNGRKKIKIK